MDHIESSFDQVNEALDLIDFSDDNEDITHSKEYLKH